MAGLLTSVGDDKDKAAVYLADCRKLGITVLPPDVNESGLNFASVGDGHPLRARRGAQCRRQRRCLADQYAHRQGQVHRLLRLPQQDRHRRLQQEGHRVADQGRRVRLARAIRARACSWCTPTPSTRCSAPRRPRRWASSTCSAAPTPPTDAVFTIKVPDEEWDDKHKLALEREMLGLYVSGHPLNGVAHLLAAQVDTQIPAILDGDVANDAQVRVGGILAVGEPARQQERDALGVSAIGGSHRRHRGDVLPADLLERTAPRSPTTPWCWSARRCESRTTGSALIANDLVVPDFSNAAGGPAAGGEPADPAVHHRQGHRPQAGAGAPSRHRRRCICG